MGSSEDNGDNHGQTGWLDQLAEIGEGLIGGLQSLVAPEGEGSLIGRWAPVVHAGGEVLSSFAEIGWYLARESIDDEGAEAPPRDMIEELTERTEALIASFPNVATLYEDVDAFDRRLRAGLDKSGADATLFAYLEWLQGFVEAVIERTIEIALDDEKGRQLSPERATQFLERVDELIGLVLDRWVFPAVIERGPRRRDGDEPRRRDERDGKTKT